MRDKIENGLRDGLIDWLGRRSQIVSTCDTIDRLAVLAFNLSLRMLPKQNWQVRISKDLAHGYMKSGKLAQKVMDLAEIAESGFPLWPYQSTLLERASYNDGLLNDWGINHLHLGGGTHPRKPDYVARTSELLYVYVFGDYLIFIDVLNHSSFAMAANLANYVV